MDHAMLGIPLEAAVLDDPAQPIVPHQPAWADREHLWRVREVLQSRPDLVKLADIRALRARLADVAAGHTLVLQAGDCAENPAECTPYHVSRKSALLHRLADRLHALSRQPVLRVGRIAGQFSKPRSRPTEIVNGIELPYYLGHMINRPEADVDSRRPDPDRMLLCYDSARRTMRELGWLGGVSARLSPIWTSHEALLLDYERSLLRPDGFGGMWLASTH